MPVGKSWRTSFSRPQARAAGPTKPRATAVSSVIAAGALESGLDRQGIPEQICRAGNIAKRRLQASEALLDAGRCPDRARHRRARTIPRPKRLPHNRAVRLRKSPRIRPQYEAVGRKPTSPAKAPRSPVWLASRSSSRAMPRIDCARIEGGHSASDSTVWQYAMEWPIEVSPATCLHDMNGCVCPARRPAARSTPAMLVAERDLQVKDLLAVALEAEMSRLDDAGVNRADRDLVDLLAFNPEEVGDAD